MSFEPSSVQRLLGHLRRLLEGIATDADRPVRSLPMVGPTERRWLLGELNDTRLGLPPGELAHHCFEGQAASGPEEQAESGCHAL